jgi:hypothetical protein
LKLPPFDARGDEDEEEEDSLYTLSLTLLLFRLLVFLGPSSTPATSAVAWTVSREGHFLLSTLFFVGSGYLSCPCFAFSLGLYKDLGLSTFDCDCSLFLLHLSLFVDTLFVDTLFVDTLFVDTFPFILFFSSPRVEYPFNIKMSLSGNAFVPLLTPFSNVMTDLMGEFCC